MQEARQRVIQLYKSWYREMPSIVNIYDVPITVQQGRVKLRQKFLQNRNVKDIRTIDLLVIKGQMELMETLSHFKQKGHVMAFFQDTVPEKPKDFLSKFLDGH